MRTKLTAASAVAVLGAGVLGAGVATAAARASSNVINACAADKGGGLRIAAKCRDSEHRVSWNKVGPRGARGPSDDYVSKKTPDGGIGYLSFAQDSQVGQMALPAGSYDLTLQVTGFNESSKSNSFYCYVVVGGTSVTPFGYATAGPFPEGSIATATVDASFKVASSQTVTFSCGTFNNGTSDNQLKVLELSAHAIRVASLHQVTS